VNNGDKDMPPRVRCDNSEECAVLGCHHRKPHHIYVDDDDDCSREQECPELLKQVRCVPVQ
jgi:hypothetical protein